MKKILSLVLVLAVALSTVAFAIAPVDAAYEAAKTYFEKADGKNMLALAKVLEIAEAGDSLIIDIRDAVDYEAGHIKGAVNIPFMEVVNHLDELPRDQRIIVICYSGQTAGQIVGSLRLGGFTAYTLSGGMGSVGEDVALETTVNAFVPAVNGELTENEKALLEAIRVSMTIPSGKNVIKVAALHENLKDYFVLDVRDKATFDKVHIEGAVNVPYLEMGGYIDQLPKDKTIAVVCNSGQQSSQTVAVLIAAGFDALNVQSGMNNGWNKAELPTVSTPVEEPAPTAETYTVKSGDCLWNIAKKLLGNGFRWKEIYELNKDIIKNPDLIYVGQVFKIPA
ncbi:MAG: LysM peptidoglycan-binding domain-containing protein [Clostridia bacterium]|nr:LysM peptidoglycan-binding domain-containing protein [Clostridia bacterium]MBR5265651.1 LysM peptidoglycan-binding domain-containing protein [Clostridia bacterium]